MRTLPPRQCLLHETLFCHPPDCLAKEGTEDLLPMSCACVTGKCSAAHCCRAQAAQALAHHGRRPGRLADTVWKRRDHAAHDGEGIVLLRGLHSIDGDSDGKQLCC